MKCIVFFSLLLCLGCQEDFAIRPIDDTIHQREESFIVSAKNGLVKFMRFFMGKKNIPAYCMIILDDSPTLDDFKQNWPIHNLLSHCVEGDTKCMHKQAQALAKGLECYDF